MTDINKQKFLTELGKLLTFMYEEDRRLALSIYDEVFEQAEDEQAVLSALASPTRQAVIIARAYNAKERKLQIYSQSRDDDGYYAGGDQLPDFVLAIEDAVPFEFTYTPRSFSEEQLTESEENAEAESEPQNDSVSSETVEDQAVSQARSEAVTEDQAVSQAHSEETAEDQAVSTVSSEEAVMDAETSEDVNAAEASAADSQQETPEESSADNSDVENSQEDNSGETDEADAEKDTDSSSSGDTEDKGQAEEPDAQAESENEEGEAPVRQDEQSAPVPAVGIEEEDDMEDDAPRSVETVSKPRIFLLILYIIFAVPITAVGILLLLIPTLLSLALAVAFISAGSVLLAATFSGFAVFADIMVMLGAALIVLALGLLVLWLFIWFIGGAMASFVHSVLDLAHKWCYKEVPAV